MKDAVVRAAPPDEGAEAIVARDALAQHVGARQHAAGRHARPQQGEDAALVPHGRADAVQEVVHAHRVEPVGLVEGQGRQDVGDDGAGVALAGADLGDGQGARFAVDEGEARGGRHAGRVEVVARADADVEVVGPHVGAEEGQEVGGCGAAPGVGVDEAEDPEVVDGEAPGGVEFPGGFLGHEFGHDGRIAGVGAADVAVGEGRGGDGGGGSRGGCHVGWCAWDVLFRKRKLVVGYGCVRVRGRGGVVSSIKGDGALCKNPGHGRDMKVR